MTKDHEPRGENRYRLVMHPSMDRIPAATKAYFAAENHAIQELQQRFGGEHEEHITKSKTSILETAYQAVFQTPPDKKTSALILGAGSCTDIPLEELTEQFDSVTLVEVDYRSTEKAVRQLPTGLQQKTTIVAADMTGILGDFSSRINNIQTPSSESFLAQATRLTKEFPIVDKRLDLGTDYTFVSSQLVMSQLGSLPWLALQETALERYGIAQLMDLMGPGRELFLASQRFTRELQQEHIRQLAHSVAREGTVHFSDTVTKIVPHSDMEERMPLLSVAAIRPVILEHFTSLEKATGWKWNHTPGEQEFVVIRQSLNPIRQPS